MAETVNDIWLNLFVAFLLHNVEVFTKYFIILFSYGSNWVTDWCDVIGTWLCTWSHEPPKENSVISVVYEIALRIRNGNSLFIDVTFILKTP